MTLAEIHTIGTRHPAFDECRRVCALSKNLYNRANYLVRQTFIETHKQKLAGTVAHATYIGYQEMRRLIKEEVDYKGLPQKVSNQTLMGLDRNWKSFFASIRDWKVNPQKYLGMPKIPRYKAPVGGQCVATYEGGAISRKMLKRGLVRLSGTTIEVPTKATGIRQARVVPVGNHYRVEVLYEKKEKAAVAGASAWGIDLGVNNLATIGGNVGKPFILNGRPLKSVNHHWNRRMAKIRSIAEKRNGTKSTKRMERLTAKRNAKVNDYLHRASRCIITQAASNGVSTLVVGHNPGWKQEICIGSRNNQNFTQIPHSRFIQMLQYKGQLDGIRVMVQEESYTSKCSFLDSEEVRKHDVYKGKRVKRGLFRASDGTLVNADLNGALNILRKAVPNAFADGIGAVAVPPRVITL